MIQVNEIAFVANPVTDKQKARDFYEGIFHLKPAMHSDFPEGFWIEHELGANTLALSNFWRPSLQPGQKGPSIAFEVDDFDQTIAGLKARNVPFVMDVLETPVCHMAVVTDPDGNSIFIHKRKPGHA
ncbi:MAG TPA: VOC family protein [Candidatus Methylacidiphilales bacterium]|nr:VOC family protein [Candidatus Methylacidiphilales bacterium]